MSLFARRAATAVLTAASIVSIGSGFAFAQTENRVANGFRIAPVRSELQIEKGKSEKITITIENPTDIETVAKPIINDFIANKDEGGEPLLILDDAAEQPKNSFKSLVGPISDVPLGPNEKKNIDVLVSVPEDANAGGYYGAIRFAPGIAGDSSNVGLTASVGTIVLVRVPGQLTEKLNLVQLSAAKNDTAKSFFTSGKVSIITRLKNDGDIHVKPLGKVQIKDMSGKIVHEYELNNIDPPANILPGSVRKFTDELPEKKWLGKYTIVANLAPSSGSGDLVSATTTFWYIPMWAIGVIGGLLLVLIVGILWVVRKFTNAPKHGVRR